MRNKSMLEWGYLKLTGRGIGEVWKDICYNVQIQPQGGRPEKSHVMTAGNVFENDGEMGEK